jgi:hypothetical protein
MDFDSLIGLEESQARFLLSKNGYNNIITVINSKDDNNCNKDLVCAVKYQGDIVTIICGKFYII